MVATHCWTLALKVPSGHRYFSENGTGRVGVADQSGSTPDRTDDGILWLDTERPIVLGADYAWIPLRRDTGEASSTPASYDEARQVSARFGLRLVRVSYVLRWTARYRKGLDGASAGLEAEYPTLEAAREALASVARTGRLGTLAERRRQEENPGLARRSDYSLTIVKVTRKAVLS